MSYEIGIKRSGKKAQNTYKPLGIIIGFILLITVVLALKNMFIGKFLLNETMADFMAGFFLVFSGFKLLDLQGFAEGYATYDVLAKRIFAYGYVYPFIELTLGILYTLHINSSSVELTTLLIMLFSGMGVAIKLAKHERFQCACLGTFLQVPLTKVTLIEDFGMAAMALVMLIVR